MPSGVKEPRTPRPRSRASTRVCEPTAPDWLMIVMLPVRGQPWSNMEEKVPIARAMNRCG